MGRPWQKKQRHEPVGKSSRKQKEKLSSTRHSGADLDEFDDDIDKFHKGSDKIPLDVTDDFELSEEEMEEPVFNLKGDSDEENESVESDEDDLDEEELSGLAAKIAKQAKILRQKRSFVEDEEVEDEDEDDDQKYKKAPWGKRKRMYYSADNVDYELQSSDEEAPAEEEAEALRLQRLKAESLRLEDFDLNEEDGKETSLEEHEHTLQEIVERKEAKDDEASGHNLLKRQQFGALKGDTKVFVEEVKKDLDLLSKEEKLEVVMSDAPELVGLLAELREGLEELQSKIEPLLNKAKAGNLVTKEGLQFLETKHMLLLCYCQSILFYLIMKSEGQSVRDHPVIARLVEIRLLIEKIQPVDQKLQDQMDKLLCASTGPSISKEIEKSINSSDNVKSNKQANAKQAVKPVSKQTNLLEGDKMEDGDLKLRRQDRIWSKNTVKGFPVELDKGEDAAVIHNLRKSSEQEKILASSESEDDDILPRKKSLHRIISTKVKASKRVGSGDMDLPAREDIGERRAKLEMQKVSSNNHEDKSEEEDDSFELEEDDFYQKAKQLKEAKQAAKELKHKKIEISEPIVEPEVGKRHISYQMEKNKGLTPHRKKLTKNPRKKYKLKHQKAVIRRKGQVRAVKVADGPYGGESTGIRTNISRSVRFKS